VRAERPEVASRFVFVTGGAFTPRAREFLDAVAAPRLEKPFDVPRLLGLVRKRVADGSGGGGA
jgi:DNA-binding NtrC family response regulator